MNTRLSLRLSFPLCSAVRGAAGCGVVVALAALGCGGEDDGAAPQSPSLTGTGTPSLPGAPGGGATNVPAAGGAGAPGATGIGAQPVGGAGAVTSGGASGVNNPGVSDPGTGNPGAGDPGTGGPGTSDPSGVTPGGGGSGAMAPPPVDPAIIDNFEDMNSALLPSAGRAGTWLAANDGTSTQTLAAEAGGANGSAAALHSAGSGFSDWGAAVQVDFKTGRARFDSSAYTGITFYARGQGSIRLEVPTASTAPSAQGGTCSADCSDSHGMLVPLTADWAPYTVMFDQLKQDGWGAPAAFNASEVLGLSFRAGKSSAAQASIDFDFWIDDVRFFDGQGEAPGVVTEPVPPPRPEPPEPIVGQCNADIGKKYDGNGSVTWYTFSQGSKEVNCSYAITGNNPDKVAHIKTGEGRYFGAMNTADYNSAAVCGACVEVTRDGGRKVVITVVDQCPIKTNPKCKTGHIDLSKEAFTQIGDTGEGYLGQGNGGSKGSISWKYVPCDVDPKLSFKLKDPSNKNWNEVLVQGHKYPLAEVTINGKKATRKAYNYWEPPNGEMGPEPFYVTVKDINGSTMTGQLTRSGGDQDGETQLMCQ